MLSRNSHRAFVFLAFSSALLLLTFVNATNQPTVRAAALETNNQPVARLGLTGLCLFTEASYCHPIGSVHLLSGVLLSLPCELSALIKKSGVSDPALLDEKSAIVRQCGVAELATTYLVGADGLIKAKAGGGNETCL